MRLRFDLHQSQGMATEVAPTLGKQNEAPKRPVGQPQERPGYIAAISASPNSEHFTSLAPSIMRAKS